MLDPYHKIQAGKKSKQGNMGNQMSGIILIQDTDNQTGAFQLEKMDAWGTTWQKSIKSMAWIGWIGTECTLFFPQYKNTC